MDLADVEDYSTRSLKAGLQQCPSPHWVSSRSDVSVNVMLSNTFTHLKRSMILYFLLQPTFAQSGFLVYMMSLISLQMQIFKLVEN